MLGCADYFVLAALFLYIAYLLLGRSRHRERLLAQAAEKSRKDMAAVFVEKPHERRQVADPAREFPFLDNAWYDAREREYVALGFRCLGNWEDVTLTKAHPRMRTYIRLFLSPDGRTSCGVYHFLYRSPVAMLVRMLGGATSIRTMDLESELSDGTWLVVTTVPAKSQLHHAPHVIKNYAPRDGVPGDLVAWHNAWLEYLHAERRVEPVVMRDLADVMAMQDRLELKSAAYRKSVGYFTEEDANRIALNETMAKDGAEMAQRIAELERKSGRRDQP